MVSLLNCSREESVSNLGRDTGCPAFWWFCSFDTNERRIGTPVRSGTVPYESLPFGH
jgi:hypothetical protein